MPIGPSEKSWREWLLNLNFPENLTLRGKQIRQFFHPEENILPETNQRPTSLTNADPTNKWRSERNWYPTQIDLPEELVGKNVKDFTYPYRVPYREPLKSSGVKSGSMFGEGSDIGRVLGLGSSTRSIGIDPKGKPYLSDYDAWDFKDTGFPLENYMTQGGTPFNVYDRIPFDLDNGKFPQSIYSGQGQDIELPKETGIGPTSAMLKKRYD